MSRIRRIGYALSAKQTPDTVRQAFRLREETLKVVESANEFASTSRRITKRAAFTVVLRSLEKTTGLPFSLREHLALKDLSTYINLAQHNKANSFTQSHTDLLPVSHPSSTRLNSLSASALRQAHARWYSDDSRITDETAKTVLASAFLSLPGSAEHLYYTSLLSGLPQGTVPTEALLAAFGDGNSPAARRARAMRQRRDRKGQFAYEGGGLRALIRRGGRVFSLTGRTVAQGEGDNIQIELPDGRIAEVPASKGEFVKAVLPTPDGYSPNEVKPSISEEADVINEEDIKFFDAPAGWERVAGRTEEDVWGDGAFVVDIKKDAEGKKNFSVYNKDNMQEPIGEYKNWADVQDSLRDKEENLAKPVARLPEQQQKQAPTAEKPEEFAFNYPEGAYKINPGATYEAQGRVDEESTNFTDDPAELAQKFDSGELKAALEKAIIPQRGNANAFGYGNLGFNRGDEMVDGVALYNALKEQDEDADMEIARIYDKALGKNVNQKALNDFRKNPEEISGQTPELEESFKRMLDEGVPDVTPIAETPSFDEADMDMTPLPPVLEGLSDAEMDQFMDSRDHTPHLSKNDDIEPPVGYNKLSSDPFTSWKEVNAENPDPVLPEGFSDNPVFLSQSIPQADLEAELRRSLEPGNEMPGYGAIKLQTEDGEDFAANVPGEAIRDALQLNGVDTNQLIEDIYNEGEAKRVDEDLAGQILEQEGAEDGQDMLPLDIPKKEKPMTAYERMVAEDKAVQERKEKLKVNAENRVDDQGRPVPDGWGISQTAKRWLVRPTLDTYNNVYGLNNFEASTDENGKITVKDRNNLLAPKTYANWDEVQADLDARKAEYATATRKEIKEFAKNFGFSDEQIAAFDSMSQEEIAAFFDNPENQTDTYKNALDDFNTSWAVDAPRPAQKERWAAFGRKKRLIDQAGSFPDGDSSIARLPSEPKLQASERKPGIATENEESSSTNIPEGYEVQNADGEAGSLGMVEIVKDGEQVGYATWNKETKIIENIQVFSGHRGKGLSKVLWSESKKLEPELKHSEYRTPDGDRFAHATGGYVPPLKTMGDWTNKQYEEAIQRGSNQVVRMLDEEEALADKYQQEGMDRGDAQAVAEADMKRKYGKSAAEALDELSREEALQILGERQREIDKEEQYVVPEAGELVRSERKPGIATQDEKTTIPPEAPADFEADSLAEVPDGFEEYPRPANVAPTGTDGDGPKPPFRIRAKVKDLKPGDITTGDHFVITKIGNKVEGTNRIEIEGYYPGHVIQNTKQWIEDTEIDVIRGVDPLPEQGDLPVLSKPKMKDFGKVYKDKKDNQWKLKDAEAQELYDAEMADYSAKASKAKKRFPDPTEPSNQPHRAIVRASDLKPGDVTTDPKKGHFVVERVFTDENTPTGKVSVEGYYPGYGTQRKEWKVDTQIDVIRNVEPPVKGEGDLHRPNKEEGGKWIPDKDKAKNAEHKKLLEEAGARWNAPENLPVVENKEQGPEADKNIPDVVVARKPKRKKVPNMPAFQGEWAAIAREADGDWNKFRELIKDKTIVFFDFETTGVAGKDGNEPWQVAGVKVRDGKIIDRFNVYMNPGRSVKDVWAGGVDKDGKPNAVDADGNPLSDEFLAKQLDQAQAMGDFFNWAGLEVEGRPLLAAHYVQFDDEVARRMADKHGLEYNPDGLLDTKAMGQDIFKNAPEKPEGNRLGQYAEFLDVNLENWHAADADAEALAEIFQKLIDKGIELDGGKDLFDVDARIDEYVKAMADYDSGKTKDDQGAADFAAAKAIRDALDGKEVNLDNVVEDAKNTPALDPEGLNMGPVDAPLDGIERRADDVVILDFTPNAAYPKGEMRMMPRSWALDDENTVLLDREDARMRDILPGDFMQSKDGNIIWQVTAVRAGEEFGLEPGRVKIYRRDIETGEMNTYEHWHGTRLDGVRRAINPSDLDIPEGNPENEFVSNKKALPESAETPEAIAGKQSRKVYQIGDKTAIVKLGEKDGGIFMEAELFDSEGNSIYKADGQFRTFAGAEAEADALLKEFADGLRNQERDENVEPEESRAKDVPISRGDIPADAYDAPETIEVENLPADMNGQISIRETGEDAPNYEVDAVLQNPDKENLGEHHSEHPTKQKAEKEGRDWIARIAEFFDNPPEVETPAQDSDRAEKKTSTPKPVKSKKEVPQDQKVRFSQLNDEEQAEVLRNVAEIEAIAVDMAGIKAEDVEVGDFLKHRQLGHYEKVIRIEEGKELGMDRLIFYVYNPIAGKEQPRPFQRISPLEFVRRVDGDGPVEKFPVGKARGRGRRKDIRVKADPLEKVKIREGRVAPAIDIEKDRGFFNGADGQPVLKGDIVVHAKPEDAKRLGRGIIKRRVGDQEDEGKKVGALPRNGLARLDYVWVQWENEDVTNAIENDGARLIVAKNLVLVNDDPAEVIENLNQKSWKGGVAKPNGRGAGRKNPYAAGTETPETPEPAVENIDPGMPQQILNEKFKDLNDGEFEINLVKIGDIFEGAIIDKQNGDIQIIVRDKDQKEAENQLIRARKYIKAAAAGAEQMELLPNLDNPTPDAQEGKQLYNGVVNDANRNQFEIKIIEKEVDGKKIYEGYARNLFNDQPKLVVRDENENNARVDLVKFVEKLREAENGDDVVREVSDAKAVQQKLFDVEKQKPQVNPAAPKIVYDAQVRDMNGRKFNIEIVNDNGVFRANAFADDNNAINEEIARNTDLQQVQEVIGKFVLDIAKDQDGEGLLSLYAGKPRKDKAKQLVITDETEQIPEEPKAKDIPLKEAKLRALEIAGDIYKRDLGTVAHYGQNTIDRTKREILRLAGGGADRRQKARFKNEVLEAAVNARKLGLYDEAAQLTALANLQSEIPVRKMEEDFYPKIEELKNNFNQRMALRKDIKDLVGIGFLAENKLNNQMRDAQNGINEMILRPDVYNPFFRNGFVKAKNAVDDLLKDIEGKNDPQFQKLRSEVEKVKSQLDAFGDLPKLPIADQKDLDAAQQRLAEIAREMEGADIDRLRNGFGDWKFDKELSEGINKVYLLKNKITGEVVVVKFDDDKNNNLNFKANGVKAEEMVAVLYRDLGFASPAFKAVNPDNKDKKVGGVGVMEYAGPGFFGLINGTTHAKDPVYNIDEVSPAHRAELLDFVVANAIIGNTDRHPGNFMWGEGPDGLKRLIPIDNGLALFNGSFGKADNNDSNPLFLDPIRVIQGRYGNRNFVGRLADQHIGVIGDSAAINQIVEFATRMRERAEALEFIDARANEYLKARADYILKNPQKFLDAIKGL